MTGEDTKEVQKMHEIRHDQTQNRHKRDTRNTQKSFLLKIFVIVLLSFGLVIGMNLGAMLAESSDTNADGKIPEAINNDEKISSLQDQSFVDVTNHGAVGDGETDDYPAIMDAIDYAVSNNEDGVYFPSGTFGIGDKIWMNSEQSGLTFLSEEDAVLKPIHEDATRIFEIKADGAGDVEDITIKGFELYGNRDNLDVDRWGNWGIHAWNDANTIRGLHIEDIHAHYFSGNGIYIDSSETTVEDVLSHHNWGHGFATGSRAQDVTFENITSHNNFSPDNPNVGSGFNIHGGQNVVINDFLIKENGYGMKTSVGQPTATVTNGVIRDNNERGYRTTGEPPISMYFENVEVSGNGASGMEFRYQGGEVIMNGVSILNNGQDSSLNDNGALFIYDDYDNFHIEDLNIEDHPGVGINSYTSGLTIEGLDISGCDYELIHPRSNLVTIEPSDLQDSYYTVDQPVDFDSFKVHSDGVVIGGEKIRALPESGEVEIDLDDWTDDDWRFTASATDTVVFEFEGLEPYTSYSIYRDGEFDKYASTDSHGSMQFECTDWSSHEFSIEEGGVNVVTRDAVDVTDNSAVLQGEVTDMDDISELEVFFRYREIDSDEWEETGTQTVTSPTEFDEKITGLSPGTEYEYRAVGQWDEEEMTGEAVSFTTGFETEPYDWQGFLDPENDEVVYKGSFPTELLTVVDSIPESDDDGGTSLDYWGEFYINGEYDGEVKLNVEPNNTEYIFEDLEPGTYQLKVEWHYDLGLIEDDEITVTIEESGPEFETLGAKEITENSAVLTGEVTDMGGYDEINVFFRLREKGQEDWIESDEPLLITEVGVFEEKWTNLAPSTSYEFQAVLEENDALILGDIEDFGTDAEYLLVETEMPREVKPRSATLRGELLGLGDNSEVEVYFEYREEGANDWTKTESLIKDETAEFSIAVNDLEPETTYEFRAVAEGDETDTGDIKAFTAEQVVPIITDLSPGEGEEINGERLQISAEMEHPLDYELVKATVRVNGDDPIEAEIIDELATVELERTLDDGEHTYEFYMEDEEGNHNSTTVTFNVDNLLPYLRVELSNDEESDSCVIHGETEPDVDVFVNDRKIDVDDQGKFEYETTLEEGVNVFEVVAENEEDKVVEKVLTALYVPELSELRDDIEEIEEVIHEVKELTDEIYQMTERLDTDLDSSVENLSKELYELDKALDENATALEDALDENEVDLVDVVAENVTEIEEDLVELEEKAEEIYSELQKEADQSEEQRELESNILFAAFGLVVIIIAVLALTLIRTKSKVIDYEGDGSETELEDWIEETVDYWFEKKQR